MEQIRWTESPRDAMQSLQYFIPLEEKVNYLQNLLSVGFDILDAGSFVSPRVIPQMKDTGEVLNNLDFSQTKTQILVVVGNLKGFQTACEFPQISYVGFPYSISETFLKLNIHSDFKKSLALIEQMQNHCCKSNLKLMVYISMAFGNPYQEPWNTGQLVHEVMNLQKLGIQEINLSDTIGAGTPERISSSIEILLKEFPDIHFGLHLHTRKTKHFEKLEAAWNSGIRSFDSVLNGLGGCPMTNYELVGNLDTLDLLAFFEKKSIPVKIDKEQLFQCAHISQKILFS